MQLRATIIYCWGVVVLQPRKKQIKNCVYTITYYKTLTGDDKDGVRLYESQGVRLTQEESFRPKQNTLTKKRV